MESNGGMNEEEENNRNCNRSASNLGFVSSVNNRAKKKSKKNEKNRQKERKQKIQVGSSQSLVS